LNDPSYRERVIWSRRGRQQRLTTE
jgi:hypothetical protein